MSASTLKKVLAELVSGVGKVFSVVSPRFGVNDPKGKTCQLPGAKVVE